MAVFNFPVRHEDHGARALSAARRIRTQFAARASSLASGPHDVAIGIGIDSGEVSFGEFGRAHRDLTAIGTVVNMAARAQSAAEAGRILVTKAVCDRARRQTAEAEGRDYNLQGF